MVLFFCRVFQKLNPSVFASRRIFISLSVSYCIAFILFCVMFLYASTYYPYWDRYSPSAASKWCSCYTSLALVHYCVRWLTVL